MGWGYCGKDRKNRDIGYSIEATCDHPGCTECIDRGLSYACGGMHGEDWFSCEDYFCPKHLRAIWIEDILETVETQITKEQYKSAMDRFSELDGKSVCFGCWSELYMEIVSYYLHVSL